jgi:hypothetical protein
VLGAKVAAFVLARNRLFRKGGHRFLAKKGSSPFRSKDG